MTTAQSPLRALKAQADEIARKLKAFEVDGPLVDPAYLLKIMEARDKPSVTIAIVMDDKILKIEIPWSTVHETSEVGLAEFILKQMKEERDHA